MRDLWWKLVPAAQTAIQYTHLQSPTQSDFAKVKEALSSTIDSLPGVFANVPKSGALRGLYPYEKIKLITYKAQVGAAGFPGARASSPQWGEGPPWSTRARSPSPRPLPLEIGVRVGFRVRVSEPDELCT